MVLGSLINHPERLNRDTLYELRSIVARYPYFQAARLLLLNNLYLLHESDFGTELRRSVLYISARVALCRLVEGFMDRVELEEAVEQEAVGLDRTLSLIDSFLGTLPEEGDMRHLQVEAPGDYVSRYLLGDEFGDSSAISSNTEGMELIDRFIGQELVSQPVPESVLEISSSATPLSPIRSGEVSPADSDVKDVLAGEESLDESYFTETLAKIYIKQRKYSRALEIIRSLYLKYPEKNIYFADQIRFLEKLIINNNSK